MGEGDFNDGNKAGKGSIAIHVNILADIISAVFPNFKMSGLLSFQAEFRHLKIMLSVSYLNIMQFFLHNNDGIIPRSLARHEVMENKGKSLTNLVMF